MNETPDIQPTTAVSILLKKAKSPALSVALSVVLIIFLILALGITTSAGVFVFPWVGFAFLLLLYASSLVRDKKATKEHDKYRAVFKMMALGYLFGGLLLFASSLFFQWPLTRTVLADVVSGRFEALKADEPDTAQVLERAKQKFLQGLYRQAAEDYRLVLEWNAENSVALNGLGISLRKIGESARESGDRQEALRLFKEAEPFIRHAIALEPKSATYTLNLVGCLALQGDYTAAIEILEGASQKGLQHRDVYFELGLCYWEANLPEKAIDAYKRQLNLYPDDVRAWTNISPCLSSLGRHKEAEETQSEAIRLWPSNWSFWHERAKTRVLLAGNTSGLESEAYLEQAEADAKQALLLNENNPDLHGQLATVYLLLERIPEAKAAFEKGVIIRPHHPDLDHNLGLLYLNEGQPQAAVEALTAAVTGYDYPRKEHHRVGEASALMHLAIARVQLGDRPGAIEALRRAIEVMPEVAKEAATSEELAALVSLPEIKAIQGTADAS